MSAQNTVAIGYNSKATVLDGVALGTGSEGTVAAGVVGYDPVKNGSSQNHTPTWKATKGAVSVGKADGSVTRQITGLAAGFNDTDAVNVAQLKGLDDVAVKYDLDSNGNKLNTVTLKGGNMTQPVTIKNVAVGTENTDAVNVSQLNTAIAGSKTHYYSVKSDVTGPGSNYDNDGATGRNALAAGVAAKAPGDGGVAVGFGATSQNTGAIAIGSKLSIAVGDSGAQATSLSSIAIGSNTKATGWGSIAIGSKMAGEIGTTEGALASAGSAVAIGAGTIAQGPSSVSLGQLAKNTRDYGIAIGSEASVESANSIAIGRKASVPAMYNISAVAIGDTALAANRSVALGASAQATGSYSLAIGGGNSNTSNTKATATEAIAIGVNALPGTPTSTEATGQQSIAIGKGAQAAAERSVAFGTRTKASGAQSTAIGADAVASDTNALSLGTKAQATKAAAIAIGLNSSATHEGAVALANGAQSSGQYSLALGVLSNAAGSYSVALGREASVLATAMNGMALGRQASVSGRHGIAMGYVASATANSIAIGVQSKTTDNQGISIGTQAQTGAVNAIAMGTGAQALGSGSIAIGRGNVVRGANSGAFGDPSIINGANSYSVGNNNTIGSTTQNAFALGNNIYLGATATGEDTIGVSGAIALGNNAFVDKAGGVALGEESRATTAAGEAGYDPATGGASKVGDSTWQSTHAAVSVGDGTTATRQITGVAAGSVDTDAVNVAQLKAVGEMAQNANQGFNIAANSSVDDVVDTRIEPGETLTVQGTGEGEFAAYDSDNIQTQVSADNTITIGLKKDLNVTSVTTGNTTINNDGLTIEGGPSVTTDGIAAGGKRITDVAAGVEATDAVNMSQLEAVAGEAGKHSSVSAGTNMVVTSGVNADGGTDYTVATAPDVAFDSVSINNGGPTLNSSGINMNSQKITGLAAGDISGTSTDAVNGSQLYNTAHTLRTEGMNFSVNVGSNVHRDLGQTLAIRGQGSTAGSYSGANVRTVSDPASGAINLQIADAPVFSGQVSAPTYVATGANPIVVSGDSGTINGLSNRTFDPGSYTSGQAATEDQLAQVDGKVSAGWNITANGKNPSNVGPGQTVDFRNTDGNIRIGKAGNNLTFNLNPNLRLSSVTTGDTRINTNGLFIKGGPSVTKAGIDAAGLQVTNVADGLAPYDAVNRGQLDALDHRLSREIDKVDDRASAGIASAMAAASVPQATIPGANLLGAGTGYYNGHSALSIGYSAMSDNGRWIIRSNFSVNSEDAAVSAGIGYQW
ncbi:MAG: hypothetical protein HQQ73_03500 [Desulfobulbaceae bacterium]|nr:hypothetical protein [Desulfobulbaceae bacterium]